MGKLESNKGYTMREPTLKVAYKDAFYTYNPKTDITTYELAKIHQFITVCQWSPMNKEDRDEYFSKYNLLRHFDYDKTIEEPKPPKTIMEKIKSLL